MSSPIEMQTLESPHLVVGRYFDEHYRPQTIWLAVVWLLQTVVPLIVKYFWVDDGLLYKTVTVLGIKVTTENPEYNKWAKWAWNLYTWYHAGHHIWLIVAWVLSYIKKHWAQEIYYWSIKILQPIAWTIQAVVTVFFIVGAFYNEAASVWKHIVTASVLDVIFALYQILGWFLKPDNAEFYDWEDTPW